MTENLNLWWAKFKANWSLLHKRAVMWATTVISFVVAAYAQSGIQNVTALITTIADVLHLPVSVVPLLIPVVVAIFAAWPQPKLTVAVDAARADASKV